MQVVQCHNMKRLRRRAVAIWMAHFAAIMADVSISIESLQREIRVSHIRAIDLPGSLKGVLGMVSC